MIENQISLLNEGYDVPEHGNDPEPSTNEVTKKQDTVLSPHLQHSLSPDRPKEEDVFSQQDEVLLPILFIMRRPLFLVISMRMEWIFQWSSISISIEHSLFVVV